MANSDTPRGLTPVRHRNGAPYNGAANLYVIPASDGTAVFIGDAVKSAGSADAEGTPTVARAAAGDAIRGVVVGVLPDTRESLPYRAASTLRKVLVADDPDLVFEIQEDSVGGALTADECGENADLIVAVGSTLTGRSRMQLDSSTHVATAAQLRILRLVRRADNEIGANAKWEVAINEHELAQTAGV